MFAIIGPTGVGKTALAPELAQGVDGEVVGADSRQVYRSLDIGTAKPTSQERHAVPHHLIDVADPDEEFSLARYLDQAWEAIADIHRRGKTVLLVGGTGQYVWALLEGWQVPRVPPDRGLRARLRQRARQEGSHALYRELVQADPASAAWIDPRNLRRVARALELLYSTGELPSRQRSKTLPAWDVTLLGLTMPRPLLYRRLDERVDRMVAMGWVEEVRALLAQGYSPDLPAFSGLGYREMTDHVAGRLTLAEAVQRTKFASHRLARRQYAWFRPADPRIRWLDVADACPSTLVPAARSLLGLSGMAG